MRSYGEFCPLAKALDVVGDRWSLLIVRELLIRGRARYSDIRQGVPGIATNLLADRLRELEAAGVVRRIAAKPPVATSMFELTDRGRALRSVLLALGEWGLPYLREASDDDAFLTHWLALPIEARLTDHEPDLPPSTIELRTGDEPIVIEAGGTIRSRVGAAEHPDAVISGPHRAIVGLLMGRIDLQQARDAGVRYEGDASVLARVRRRDVPATA
jgi:DNA-binding HxlR family transcriptional regulator